MNSSSFASLAAILLIAWSGIQSASASFAKPVVELAEQLSKTAGRTVPHSTVEAMERAFLAHGQDALEIIRHQGLGLAESTARHGDEIMSLAVRVPESAPLFVHRAEELLPLARRYGDDFLRLEARIPGLGEDAFRLYQRPGEISRVLQLPPEQAKQLISYASHARDPHASSALLRAVEEKGPTVLERLDPRKILALGLSTAMVVAASGGSVAAATAPESLFDTITALGYPIAIALAVCVLAVGAVKTIALVRRLRFRRR